MTCRGPGHVAQRPAKHSPAAAALLLGQRGVEHIITLALPSFLQGLRRQAQGERDSEQSQIVELRFFGGLTLEETAEVLGVSPATVKREWGAAKLWLLRELNTRR
ncbi:MAG: hypothetical protein H0T77_07320 [Pyrinomonadaceae bacterium]|nr:hypothetical protein [Pyrinomonadaceae bacterium]